MFWSIFLQSLAVILGILLVGVAIAYAIHHSSKGN
jgi:hypothetical protein